MTNAIPTNVITGMSQQDFMSKYLDEIVGLLLSGYAVEENSRGMADINLACRGRHFVESLTRARRLLIRVYNDLNVKVV